MCRYAMIQELRKYINCGYAVQTKQVTYSIESQNNNKIETPHTKKRQENHKQGNTINKKNDTFKKHHWLKKKTKLNILFVLYPEKAFP